MKNQASPGLAFLQTAPLQHAQPTGQDTPIIHNDEPAKLEIQESAPSSGNKLRKITSCRQIHAFNASSPLFLDRPMRDMFRSDVVRSKTKAKIRMPETE
ncbi:hypothetical protein CONLIGDRAFT_685863 [Coniochaeta ligniaria NRRL 30616]|uniref:Uncharacterized protein n=1 Tax=Coniochaeta ligniaria NRRL 30616 TaxID=1408157 RepID=A0A1J7J528_9PEZI|nr:hypothetical protein CONLIGDRAFT_685863 [Coniochaeta ligniaria NRRL 30616]